MAAKAEIARTGWREAGGIVLLAIAVLTILSMVSYDAADISVIQSPPKQPPSNFIGPVGAWFAFIVFMALGVAGYLLPVALAALGLFCLFKREGRVWLKATLLSVCLLGAVVLVQQHGEPWANLVEKLNLASAGGVLGHLLGDALLVGLLGDVGATTLCLFVVVLALVFIIEIHPAAAFQKVTDGARALHERYTEAREIRQDRRAELDREEKELSKRRRRLEEALQGHAEEAASAPEPAASPEPEPEPEPVAASSAPDALPGVQVVAVEPPPKKPKRRRGGKQAVAAPPTPSEAAVGLQSVQSNFMLPTMDLLDELPPLKEREIKGDFQRSSSILKETLAEFGIEADVTNVERGPVVTRYEVLPAPGVRVEKITQLSNNIALAMKAESVRVQAPIPGKGVVGIEVPNLKSTVVYLRDILESSAWENSNAALPLALGKDVAGRVVVGDLAEMPHVLIAGATGAGKTVCMNSLLAGLLMSRTPDQMRLMLIDPKIVEFTAYDKLPHLVVPVITDAKKVIHGLRWAISEMEKRYKLFAKVGVRNIAAFNSRPIAKQTDMFAEGEEEEEQRETIPDRIPYLVIIVDELADLMLVAQAEIESGIARLAQLSRAVGIHMIIATQRPSVNVITGTIKANLPARIAFQVAQKTDSRTILDATGADKLLGKGDMLFLPPASSKLIRVQGTLTSDQEVHGIVAAIKDQGDPQYETEIKQKLESKTIDLPDLDQDDELLETAVEIIRQTKRASTSSLQRRLRIGYTRAARLMDLLEEKGVVGPPRGSDPREILIDLDGEIPQNESQTVGAE